MRALHAIRTFLCPPVLCCVIVEAGGRERVKVKVGQQWRRRRAGGAWEKASRIHAPETSYECSGVRAGAVEAAIVANSGCRWRYGGQVSGHQVREVEPTLTPMLLEQHDSAESTAGGASERFEIKYTTKKTVSR